MSGQLSQEVKAEPNLTPMLDMVFQLITFFMLVINFKSAEMDLSLKLPVVGSARPVETKGQRDLLVLNIDKTGNLKIYGRVDQGHRGLHRQRSRCRADGRPHDVAPTSRPGRNCPPRS